jgi:hypothetical protein
MMRNLFKRLGGRALLAALLVSALILALKQIADVDALLHLSLGKLFWTMQGFPDNEVFCYLPHLEVIWLLWIVSSRCFVYGANRLGAVPRFWAVIERRWPFNKSGSGFHCFDAG